MTAELDKKMNKLEICRVGYKYEIDGKEQANPHYQTEFIVDGMSLSERFNFDKNRPWFGQTEFESSSVNVDEFKGKSTPANQLGNGRFVLYRCHCGSDYCGVIACRVIRTETTVKWGDIFYGDEDGAFVLDDGSDDEGIVIDVTGFEFSIDEYDQVLDDYHRNLG